jgi:hypothetical protein
MPKKYEMKTVNTYDEAYKIGSKYIDNLSKSSASHMRPDNLPVQISNPMWEMSLTSLRNTLKYICELLHHQCYMLCIHDNNILMCKLDMQTTAPIFQKAIEKQLSSLDSNPTITEAQRKFIRDSIGKNKDRLRVMQCIVKPFSEDKGEDKAENEYLQLLKGLKLPDGVFILNLTDAVILRNYGKSPFAMVTGKVQLDSEYVFDKHLPILSISGQRHYLDIPIPNYDDVMTVLKQTTVKTNATRKSLHQYKITQTTGPVVNAFGVKWDSGLVTDWAKKKKTRAVFRGGPTGCGYTEETNMRLKLDSINSNLLDVRLSKPAGASSIDTKSIRFDPKYGLGVMNTRVNYQSSFLNMRQQSEYKYIIHVDGNVNAYRLLTTMTTGSLILRVMSPYTSWVDHMIKAKVHYIPVKEDLSDLLDVIKWCKKNDDRCREIANNGLIFARSVLNKKFIQSYLSEILWSLAPEKNKDYTQMDVALQAAPLPVAIAMPPAIAMKAIASEEYLEMPEDKKQCPKGYKSVQHEGRKKCKKTKKASKPPAPKTKKVRFVDESEYVDIPEGKKQCPKGYKAAQHEGRKRCKKNVTKKSPPKLEIADDDTDEE